MAYYELPKALRLPGDLLFALGGLETSTTLNATVTRLAISYTARDNADKTGLFFRTGTVTSSQTLKAGIQANSSGAPSGTYLGSGNNGFGTVSSPTATTLYNVTFTSVVPQTKGTLYWMVIEWDSTAGTLNIVRSLLTAIFSEIPTNYNYSLKTFTSPNWSGGSTGIVPTIIAYSNEASWYDPCLSLPASSSSTNSSFNSGSTPDEYANRIYLPSCKIDELWVTSDQDNVLELRIYDDSSTLLGTAISVVGSDRPATAYGLTQCPLPSILTLPEGWYRVALLPTSVSNITRFTSTFLSSQAGGRSMPTTCYLSTRVNGGSWTDDTLSQMNIGVKVCAIETGTSAPGFSLSNLVN